MGQELTTEAVADQINEIVKELLGRRIDLDENFFEAGLNSLSVTKLHALISKRLGTQIPEVGLFSHPNLRGAAALVVDATGPTSQVPRDAASDRTRRSASSRREIRARLRRDGETR
ncbi:MAG: hypothetical protein GEV12_05560 [Micromonosporaceae bacterium]|nr:hypothetical protein [Micromonosporaceae bacterium]